MTIKAGALKWKFLSANCVSEKRMNTYGDFRQCVMYRLQERSLWQFIPKGSPGSVHLFGELQGINDIKPKHQVEIIPNAVGRMERFEKVEGNPFLDGKSGKLSAGLDRLQRLGDRSI